MRDPVLLLSFLSVDALVIDIVDGSEVKGNVSPGRAITGTC